MSFLSPLMAQLSSTRSFSKVEIAAKFVSGERERRTAMLANQLKSGEPAGPRSQTCPFCRHPRRGGRRTGWHLAAAAAQSLEHVCACAYVCDGANVKGPWQAIARSVGRSAGG